MRCRRWDGDRPSPMHSNPHLPTALRTATLLLTCLLHVGLLWLVWDVLPARTEPAAALQVQILPLALSAPREPMPSPAEPAVTAPPNPPPRPAKLSTKLPTSPIPLPPLPPVPIFAPVAAPAPATSPADGRGEADAPAAALPVAARSTDLLSTPPSPAPDAGPAGPPPDYVGRILAKLERAKRYPAAAKAARLEGTVMLRFAIDRRGRLLDWRIEGSSGVPALDEEVGTLVRRAAPFPPFPDDMDRDRMELTVPIDFSLSTR